MNQPQFDLPVSTSTYLEHVNQLVITPLFLINLKGRH